MEKEHIGVAIIDRGLNPEHERLSGCTISEVSISTGALSGPARSDRSPYQINHGTSIASIIYQSFPKVDLYSVKLVTQPGGKLDEALLNKGLEWCLAQPEVRIINISMGIVQQDPSQELYAACRACISAGKIIIASCHNDLSKKCFPAFFPFVFGVGVGFFQDRNAYRYLGEGYMNVLAKGGDQRVAVMNDCYSIASGTSYATAHFSAIVARMLHQNESITSQHIWEVVQSPVLNTGLEIPSPYRNYNTDALRNADFRVLTDLTKYLEQATASDNQGWLLFPESDVEIDRILRHYDPTRIPIKSVLDYPTSSRKSTPEKNKHLKFTAGLLPKDVFAGIRTVVVGNFLEGPSQIDWFFAYKLVELAIANQLDLIVWHRRILEEVIGCVKAVDGYFGNVYLLDGIDASLVSSVHQYEAMPQSNVPMVAIVAADPAQDLLRIEMVIKALLTDNGYDVYHLTGFPHAGLIGADLAFSIENEFPYPEKNGHFFGQLLKKIALVKQPDIIITGIFSGILDGENNNTSRWSLSFLAGTQPDAVVLVERSGKNDRSSTWGHSQIIEHFLPTQVLFSVRTEDHIPVDNDLIDSRGIPSIELGNTTAEKTILDLIKGHFREN